MQISTNKNNRKSNFDNTEDSYIQAILLDEVEIIDILLNNQSSTLEDSIQLFELIVTQEIKGYITDKSLLAIYTLANKLKGKEETELGDKIVSYLVQYFIICKVDTKTSPELYNFNFTDKIDINKLDSLYSLVHNKTIDIIISQRPNEFLSRYKLKDINHNTEQKILIVSPTDFLDWYDLEDDKISLHNYIVSKESPVPLVKFIGGEDYSSQIIESLEKNLRIDNDNLRDEQIIVGDWLLENFEIYSSKNHYAHAKVTLQNRKNYKRITDKAKGNGAIDALCRAFDNTSKSLIPISRYFFKFINLYNIDEGFDSHVSATVVISYKEKIYEGKVKHTDSIKAAFFAYLQAINNVYEDKPISPKEIIKTVIAVTTKYEEGKRNFEGVNLSNKIISKVSWLNINLSKANLKCAYIVKCELLNANLYRANLDGITIVNADLSNANLFCANISNATVQKSNLQGTKLNKVKLNQASLVEVDLKNAVLDNAQLNKANLSMSDLTEANLHEATLIKVIFSHTVLMRADLTDADLTDADLTGADLSEANLSRADLTRANLTNVDLSGADLTGANLTDVNLSNANLTRVNFTNTTVDGANFSEANLSHADLTDLNLKNTVFCKPLLTDTAMPEIKIEIYGQNRIEGMILLFSQFESNHYKIFAVHSHPFDVWWNNDMGIKFRKINNELRKKGIPIQRVFIVPEGNINNEMNDIIKEQVDLGIEIRYLSENYAGNFDGFNLRGTNLLVCENTLVKPNSFTTMMLINEKQKEESGYISFVRSDLEMNKQRFNMIWEKAETYSQNLCGGGTKASC